MSAIATPVASRATDRGRESDIAAAAIQRSAASYKGRSHRAVASGDSLRGLALMRGRCVNADMTIALTDTAIAILDGPTPHNILVQLHGLDIVVFGRRRNAGQRWPLQGVDRFIVRRSGGRPAYDGVLRITSAGAVLDLSEGGHLALSVLPDSLARATGMRVWIAGPLSAPSAAGVIDPQYRLWCPE